VAFCPVAFCLYPGLSNGAIFNDFERPLTCRSGNRK